MEGMLVLPTYEEGPTDWWDYTAGALAGALGNQQEADQSFQKALPPLTDAVVPFHPHGTRRSSAVVPSDRREAIDGSKAAFELQLSMN